MSDLNDEYRPIKPRKTRKVRARFEADTMKWASLDEVRPVTCDNILFSDGDSVYAGWLETWEPGEDLLFYDSLNNAHRDGITHWCALSMIKLPT